MALAFSTLALAMARSAYGALLGGNGGVESRLRRGAFGHELLGPAEVELGLVQIGLSPPDAGLLQVDIGLGHGDPASSSRTRVSKLDGSMRASTWPCLTSLE